MEANNCFQRPHGDIHVGCSGWVYKHWRGIFYPEGLPQKRWFEHYAEEFDTVEINNSFYRLPLAETFESGASRRRPASAMRSRRTASSPR